MKKNKDKRDKAELGRPPAKSHEVGADRSTEIGATMIQTGFAENESPREGVHVQSPLVDPVDYPSRAPQDERIARTIRDLIAQDSRLDGETITVRCISGEVAIEGQASTPGAEQDLIARASDVPGVRAVHTSLRVR